MTLLWETARADLAILGNSKYFILILCHCTFLASRNCEHSMLWLQSIILTRLVHKKMMIYNNVSMPGKLWPQKRSCYILTCACWCKEIMCTEDMPLNNLEIGNFRMCNLLCYWSYLHFCLHFLENLENNDKNISCRLSLRGNEFCKILTV